MIATADIAGPPAEGTGSRVYADRLNRLYADSATSFSHPTPSETIEREHERRERATRDHGERTRVATVADPEVVADLVDAPELRAIEELRAWLHLSYDDVARAVGLSSVSLLHYWRQRYRTGRPPRPRAATVEQLWRVHALVRAVAEALQGADQARAVQLWFRHETAGTSALELLLAGRLDEVERRARPLLFDQRPRTPPPWRVAALEHDGDLQSVEGQRALEYKDSDFA